jgi:hypothetical protein
MVDPAGALTNEAPPDAVIQTLVEQIIGQTTGTAARYAEIKHRRTSNVYMSNPD